MWETSHCTSLAVGIRESPGATLTMLYDSTDVTTPLHRYYSDDPCESKMQEKSLWYVIVEVDFGVITETAKTLARRTARPVTTGTPVARAHMEKVRVCVFHVQNEYARAKFLTTRMRLRQMFADCVRYQVDFVGGDANAASYRWKSTQFYHTPTASSLNIMAGRAATVANQCLTVSDASIDIRGAFGVQMVTNNTNNELLNLEKTYQTGTEQEKNDLGYDCIVLIAYTWGHTHKERLEFQRKVSLSTLRELR